MIKKTNFTNADELLDNLQGVEGFSLSCPVNVDKIAEVLNIKVENIHETSDVVGQILFQEDKPLIRINLVHNNYEPRRRFTMAHEIAHYCLHSNESTKVFVDTRSTMSRTDSYWDICESQANSFAADLLMPECLIFEEAQPIVKRLCSEHGKLPQDEFIDSMARRFEVSNKAMEYRLINLKLIGD